MKNLLYIILLVFIGCEDKESDFVGALNENPSFSIEDSLEENIKNQNLDKAEEVNISDKKEKEIKDDKEESCVTEYKKEYYIDLKDFSEFREEVTDWKIKYFCEGTMSGVQVLNQSTIFSSVCDGNKQYNLLTNLDLDLKYYEISFKHRKVSKESKEKLLMKLGKNKISFKSTENWKEEKKVVKIREKDISKKGKVKLNLSLRNRGSFFDGIEISDLKISEVSKCDCDYVKKVISVKSPNIDMDLNDVLGPRDDRSISLGFGGEIIVDMGKIVDYNGADLFIDEHSDSSNIFRNYPEKAKVYGSKDLSSWIFLGVVRNNNKKDKLGLIDVKDYDIRYLKIKDFSNDKKFFNGNGYDLDSIKCLRR